MAKEIWEPVKGFEDRYFISNKGRVKSLGCFVKKSNGGQFFRPGKIIKNFKLKDRYLVYHLMRNGIKKTCYAHRLVAIHFIDNPENKPQVNHKDANRFNNIVSNLEWATDQENKTHASKMMLFPVGEKNKQAKLNKSEILLIRNMKGTCKQIGDAFGICAGHVCDIKNRKRWKHI